MTRLYANTLKVETFVKCTKNIKGHKDSLIEYGNILTNDQFSDMRFDYLLAKSSCICSLLGSGSLIQKDQHRGGLGEQVVGVLPGLLPGHLDHGL